MTERRPHMVMVNTSKNFTKKLSKDLPLQNRQCDHCLMCKNEPYKELPVTETKLKETKLDICSVLIFIYLFLTSY